MELTSSGTNDVVEELLRKYADMVRRICFLYLRNTTDVEDVFQNVFLKLLQRKPSFENEEHEKAWLCTVTINACKDECKSFFRKKVCPLEEAELPCEDKTESDVMRAVLSLPVKYRELVYLFYYAGYTVPEMAKLLRRRENTIYSDLHRVRKILKEKLEDTEYAGI